MNPLLNVNTLTETYEAAMDIQAIESEAEYDRVLAAIQVFFENEPEPGSPEAHRFNALAALIESYERKRWPIEG